MGDNTLPNHKWPGSDFFMANTDLLVRRHYDGYEPQGQIPLVPFIYPHCLQISRLQKGPNLPGISVSLKSSGKTLVKHLSASMCLCDLEQVT